MANDEELIQRLRDNKDIRPEDITNKQNIKMVNENAGISFLTYELSEEKKKEE